MKQLVTDCDTCNGTGRTAGVVCPKCGGSGRLVRLVPDDTPGATPVYTAPDPNARPTWAQVVVMICSTLSALATAGTIIVTSLTHSKVEEVHLQQQTNASELQSVQKEVKAARQEVKSARIEAKEQQQP